MAAFTEAGAQSYRDTELNRYLSSLDDDGRDVVPPTLAQLQARNARIALHRDLRVMKGRPEFRIATRQYDRSKDRVLAPTVAPDPILDLYVARTCMRRSAENAQRYGELRQRVVSPLSVALP